MDREEPATSKMSAGGRTHSVPPYSLDLSVQVNIFQKLLFIYHLGVFLLFKHRFTIPFALQYLLSFKMCYLLLYFSLELNHEVTCNFGARV